MRIGTYNLQFLFDEGVRLHSGKEYTFTAEFVEKRFAFFAKQFDTLNADIIFLQEIGDESALQKILKQTKDAYAYFIAQPDKYGVGNAVVYRKDLKCACSSEPTNARLPVFNEKDEDILGSRMWSRRDYIKLETTYKGKPLVLFGVHVKSKFLMYKEGASFPESPETVTQVDAADAIIRSEMFRYSQVKRIRELVNAVFAAHQDSQVAVLGDINTTESTEMFKIIIGKLKDRDDTLVHAFGSDTVDHVFISRSLVKEVVGKDIFNESIVPASPDSIGSDHAPIVIELASQQ
ncbi:MAG: endonuclease/exonuclease/phosphatase family protein [bacterium]|nr:endonuclease/exonuclease/phosphatase family protein [bacterium]